MKWLDVLLRRTHPEDERVVKGQAIEELAGRVDVQLQRADRLIAERPQRLSSYRNIRFKR